MGLLFRGTAMTWQEAKAFADHVHEHGITQLINLWHREKDRLGDPPLWGDEVELMLVSFDDEGKNAKLSLRQQEVLLALDKVGHPSEETSTKPHYHEEYSRYTVEAVPGEPFSADVQSLLSVESNMMLRRRLVLAVAGPHEVPMSISAFPRLGATGQFTEPYYDPVNGTTVPVHSLFVPEEGISQHTRYPMCTANIAGRRGSKVACNLPVFVDTHTLRPFIDPTIPWERNAFPEDGEARDGAALVDHIYLDHCMFGMGCGCLQVTFQACDVKQARQLYDALIPLTPIMLAITACSPVWRGFLADVDCRWNTIADTMDDRTEEERGLKPLNESKFKIPKSRFGSVDTYLSTDPKNKKEYNDVPVPTNDLAYKRLRDAGMDHLLAEHFAHLFIRDPIILFSDNLDQDDAVSTLHFENIQTSNWQSVRFKPPPSNASIGWRVEFRTMECGPTDFENAAFAVFMALISRAILEFDANLYLPMSKVDENMQRAQQRDAARTTKFWFRKDICIGSPPPSVGHSPKPQASATENSTSEKRGLHSSCDTAISDEYEHMSLKEIFCGKEDRFPGLIGLVDAYLCTLGEEGKNGRINEYLDFIRRRASGDLVTPAQWMRSFIRDHPDYKFDSVVNQSVNYDLCVAINEIATGSRPPPSFLPEYHKHRDQC